MPPPHVGKSPAHIVSKNIKAGKTSDSIEYRLTGAIHQAEMPLDAGSYSTTVPVAEGYGSWAEAAGRYPQDAARLLWSRDAWLADVPALRGRAGCSGGMIGPIEKVSPPGETGWRVSAYGVASGAAQCIQPKVEIEAGKADLIREILGVNDLQDINLLDEYRDIFIKSQKSVYENESVNDINCTD